MGRSDLRRQVFVRVVNMDAYVSKHDWRPGLFKKIFDKNVMINFKGKVSTSVVLD